MSRDDQKTRSEQVRQAILDTALQIGMEEGFEAVSIRRIVDRMKYSTGVIYHHFQDKQEIIDAIEAAESQRFFAMIRGMQDETKGFLENMRTTFHRTMLLALEEPEKYNLIVLHKYSRHNPAAPMFLGYLSTHLQQAMDAGQLRKTDPERLAFCLWSSFLGFHLALSRSGMEVTAAEALFDEQYSMILQGILYSEERAD
jgi:AcrR family transcriptional regulator